MIECYASLTFHYTKKKRYEKFRGSFEHDPVRPLLNPHVETITINDKVTILQKEIWYFILMCTQYRI